MSDKNWFNDPEFWLKLEPFLFPPKKWEEVIGEVDGLIKLTEAIEGSSILDLGCGPGRHSIEMARRGFLITGVDLNGAYLKKLEATAADEKLEIETIQADMRDYSGDGKFDLAINLYTAFGYFEKIEDDRRVLRNLMKSLKPGGLAVLQMSPKERLLKIFLPETWQEIEGAFLLEQHTPSADWSILHNRWIHFGSDGIKTEWEFGLRLYSAVELRNEMLAVGFDSVEIFGDLTGAPFAPAPRWLVAVGRK